MPATSPVHVVGAILDRSGQILACRRAPGRASAGKWEFPGGKVEEGESDEQALARELREELNVDAVIGDLLIRHSTNVGNDLIIDLSCYHATIVGPMPTQSTDHDEMRWVTPDELATLVWTEPDLPAVALLKVKMRE